jgi:hypothetical protein
MVRGFGFATSGFQQGVFAGARGIGRFVAWPWHPHMIQVKPTIVELDMDKLEEILRRLDAEELDADDYGTIKAVIGAYVHLYHLVGDKDTTIATCQLCGANPFDYLTKLDRHADCAAANPAAWMPWNYRQTCATLPGTAS